MNTYKLLKIIKKFKNILQETFYKYDKNQVYIEISGCCNAKCSYCITGVGKHKTNTKFMTPDTFEKIIKHLIKIKIINKNIKTISLFNFGEPFLNPYFNEILAILGKYNLTASISSNFIKYPDISPENYKNISQVIFSLCSFNKEKYKRIYKADLDKVLENYNEFLIEKNKYNPKMNMSVHWLRYHFNKDEFDYAKKYFNERNIYNVSDNYYAHVGDMEVYFNLAAGKDIKEIEYFNMEEAFKDINFEREQKIIKKYAPKNPKTYKCPQKRYLTINEAGQLAGCCGVYSKNPEYNLGNILELNKKKIYELEKSMKICEPCLSHNLAWYSHNSGSFYM